MAKIQKNYHHHAFSTKFFRFFRVFFISCNKKKLFTF